jgi:phosphoglucosamine mutase
MPRQFFGTDGIRGIPGVAPLDDATLFALGRSVAEYLHRDHASPHALIGTDTRESGPHIASVVAAGLAQGGASVSFAGILTTPGVACLVRNNDFHVGVVVSASHNPYQDNGVKLFSHEGMKFPDAVEEQIEAGLLRYRAENPAVGSRNLHPDDSLHHQYLDFLSSRALSGASHKGLRIVLDCANGAAYKLGPELFSSLGYDIVCIGTEPDGRNINAGCGSLHLEKLQQRVPAERAAFGVAFDGDADRALFVSAEGRIINGDGVLLAVARHLKSQNKLPGNRVVATSMSNLGLERVLAREHISLARTNVGDRYVLEEMLRSGNILGGEQSGHVIFLEDSPAGDGLLTAVKIASLVAAKGSLDSLVAGLKDYPQTILNVKVKSKPPLDSLPAVSRALAEANASLRENGRIVLRYSGTEQLARVMVEAEHDSDVQRFSQSIASAIRSSIGS